MLRLLWSDVSGLCEEDLVLPLSSYRLDKLSRTKTIKARVLGIAAEHLLIRGLSELRPDLELPLVLSCEKNGKPFLLNEDLAFNLSHSWPYVGCVLSYAPVGLDI